MFQEVQFVPRTVRATGLGSGIGAIAGWNGSGLTQGCACDYKGGNTKAGQDVKFRRLILRLRPSQVTSRETYKRGKVTFLI